MQQIHFVTFFVCLFVCFIIPLAVGPVRCSDLVPASGVTFALLGVIVLIALLCCCFACVANSTDDDAGVFRGCIYCCSCVVVVLFVALVIASSAIVFTSPALPAVTDAGGNCSLAAAPMATVAFSYGLCFIFSLCWCCACSCLLLSSGH